MRMTLNERRTICERKKRDIQVMSSGDKLNLAKTSLASPPAGCARESESASPGMAKRILHLKGFAGGVPLNSETAAVKPRAGIE